MRIAIFQSTHITFFFLVRPPSPQPDARRYARYSDEYRPSSRPDTPYEEHDRHRDPLPPVSSRARPSTVRDEPLEDVSDRRAQEPFREGLQPLSDQRVLSHAQIDVTDRRSEMLPPRGPSSMQARSSSRIAQTEHREAVPSAPRQRPTQQGDAEERIPSEPRGFSRDARYSRDARNTEEPVFAQVDQQEIRRSSASRHPPAPRRSSSPLVKLSFSYCRQSLLYLFFRLVSSSSCQPK